ncbi:hypothetical protein B0I37DRAFT_447478 [Chaetomium sp. MPI-CAGE-AT-0009]|nr:hypothetical protein B0I37DRAFT_447478 [Chaetomium sp. MPI-CAGE-AT-0009]
MFSSFRVVDATGLSSAEPTKSAGRAGGRVHALVACNQCRIRKLKCSGGKEGCTRCQATGSTCFYSQTPRKGRRQAFMPYSESTDDLARMSKLTPPREQDGEEATRPGQRQQGQDVVGRTTDQEQLPGSTGPPQADTLAAINTSLSMQNTPSIARDISSSALSSASESSWDSATMDVGLHTPSLLMDDELYDFDLSVITGATTSSTTSIPSTITPPTLMSALYDTHDPMHSTPTTATISTTTTTLSSATTSPGPTNLPFLTLPFPPPTPTTTPISTTPTQGAGGCRCLGSMAQLLEEIGVRRAGAEDAGMDGLLMCLHLGTRACNEVLACARCRLCSQYSMLVVTVLRQLGDICRDLGDLLARSLGGLGQVQQLLQQRQQQQGLEGGSVVIGGRVDGAGGLPRQGHETLLDGTIWFGRYSIKTPKMRDSLVQSLISLHLSDLKALLRRLKSEIGRKRGRWELVVEVEEEVERVYRLTQETGMASVDETAHGPTS